MHLPEMLPPQPLKTLYTKSHPKLITAPHTTLVVRQVHTQQTASQQLLEVNNRLTTKSAAQAFTTCSRGPCGCSPSMTLAAHCRRSGPRPAKLPWQSPVTGDCCMDPDANQHRDKPHAAGTSFFTQCRHCRRRCRRQRCCCHPQVRSCSMHKSTQYSAAATTLLTPARPRICPLTLILSDKLVVA